MSQIVLKAENISKFYRLGQVNSGMLYKDIQSWIAKKRGKEDPNAVIGITNADQCEADGFWALKDINFEIKQGDRIGIIGENGAGKSTLLKLISEITAPTTGTIRIKGRVESLLEVGTGFHPEMTGRENIYMNGAILGMKKAEIDRNIDEIIDFSGIEKYIDTPVKRYSSGMYVKLAFAVAAHLESEILIADEVLAVGDVAFQKKALDKMNDLSTNEGRTVLFVSHNMSSVRAICNQGILLNKGKISMMGEIAPVINEYLGKAWEAKTVDFKEEIAKLPEDASFRFLDIHARQNGEDIGLQVGNANPIDIELSYEILKEEFGLRVCFDILDSNGEFIIRSFNFDRNQRNFTTTPGKYISKVQIPTNFLGPVKYILRISAAIHNVRSCTGKGIKIPIDVVQDSTYIMEYPGEPFRGKLRCVLPWENERLK